MFSDVFPDECTLGKTGPPRVAIVGAGIGGGSAAYFVRKRIPGEILFLLHWLQS